MKLQAINILIVFILGAFFNSQNIHATEVGEKNQDIIHVKDLDRSKIKMRSSNGGIVDYNESPKNLEGQLDKSLDDFTQLDPANAKPAARPTAPKPLAQVDDLEDPDELSANPKEVIESAKANPGNSDTMFGNMLGVVKDKVLSKLLKTNPLSNMSHDQVKSFLKERFKGSKFEKVLENNPRLLNIMAALARDSNALPSLVGIFDEKEKMLTYTYGFILIFILGIILNIFMFSKANVLKRILFKISLSLAIPACNFLLFYLMFRKQLDPTLTVIKNNW